MAAESARGFKFEPGGIGAIFKTHRLKVPTFQREYAWEVEEVLQLFNDLNRANSENSEYFLGTIVTVAKGMYEPLEIVDGQQRLTTTALLIAAIREEQKRLGQPSEVIESINNDYLWNFDRKRGNVVPKLILNIDDNEFFSSLIRGEPIAPSRESHRRLADAYTEAQKFIARLVHTFGVADKPSVLNNWLEFIEHEATVILVQTDNAAKAFKMFETLNDRGLKTSQADLVKSYLFGQADSRVSEAQSRWSSMKDNLESIGDDDRAVNYLRHVLIATKKFLRAEEIYETVQTTVRGEISAISFVSTLEAMSRRYVATFQPSSEYWVSYSAKSVNALEVFNKFNLKPIRPLILTLSHKFSVQEFEKAIKLLASLSVRLVITGKTRSGTIETTFADAAVKVFEEVVVTALGLKSALSSVIVSDADFYQDFSVARVSNASLARYYLRALEAASSNQQEPWYVENSDPVAMTLEHVLPQNAGQDWGEIDPENQKAFVRRLGNLCIMNKSGNEALGNRSYKEKRGILKTAQYKLTSMVAEEEVWGPAQIEARQRKLAELALRAWPV